MGLQAMGRAEHQIAGRAEDTDLAHELEQDRLRHRRDEGLVRGIVREGIRTPDEFRLHARGQRPARDVLRRGGRRDDADRSEQQARERLRPERLRPGLEEVAHHVWRATIPSSPELRWIAAGPVECPGRRRPSVHSTEESHDPQ